MTQLKKDNKWLMKLVFQEKTFPYSSQAQSMRCFMSLMAMPLALK